jgi:hypothetical protein
MWISVLKGCDNAFVLEHDQILYEDVTEICRKRAIALQEQRRQMGRKLGGLCGIELCDLARKFGELALHTPTSLLPVR